MDTPTPLKVPHIPGLGNMSPRTMLLALEKDGGKTVLDCGGEDFPSPGSPLCGFEVAEDEAGMLFIHFHVLSRGMRCRELSDSDKPFPADETCLELRFQSDALPAVPIEVNPMERIAAPVGVDKGSIERLLHPLGPSAVVRGEEDSVVWDIALGIPCGSLFTRGTGTRAAFTLRTPGGRSCWKDVLEL